MKKILTAIQIVFLFLSFCACTEEVTDIKSLLPQKEVIKSDKSDSPTDKMIYNSIDQLVMASDCIIEGEVLDEGTVYSAYDEYLGADCGMMYFKIKVLNIIKGDDIADEIIIAQLGASTDSMEVKYKKGEHIISFLYQLDNSIPGTEEYPYSYTSVSNEDGNFRVVQVEYNKKLVSIVQCFGSVNILQYDGKSLSDFLNLLK